MAKTHGQRLKILYILDFLKRESDEEHPVTAKDICEFLDSQGISSERKSVYADIDLNYKGNSFRPTSFDITYYIDGEYTMLRIYNE